MKDLSCILVVVLLSLMSCGQFYESPDDRDNFVGNYQAVQYSSVFDETVEFPVDISNDGDPYSQGIYLKNFYGIASLEVLGKVRFFEFEIPKQRINNLIITGSARLGVDEVIMTYTVENRDTPSVPIDSLVTTLTFR